MEIEKYPLYLHMPCWSFKLWDIVNRLIKILKSNCVNDCLTCPQDLPALVSAATMETKGIKTGDGVMTMYML